MKNQEQTELLETKECTGEDCTMQPSSVDDDCMVNTEDTDLF